jgi:predicted enzyme related to lactoylglutathione lyase
MDNSGVRIGSVVIDVKDFAKMRGFWQQALGYGQPRPTPPGGDFAILKDPAGRGPNVSIDGMPPYRNVIHLDLYTEDHDGEVKRLLALGATVFRPREEGEDFTVLADPEGNLFCVVDTRAH